VRALPVAAGAQEGARETSGEEEPDPQRAGETVPLGHAAPQPSGEIQFSECPGRDSNPPEAPVNDAQSAQVPEVSGPGTRRRSAKRKDGSATVTTVTASSDPSGYIRFAERAGLKIQQPSEGQDEGHEP